MSARVISLHRVTRETDVEITLCLDGQGKNQIESGVGFLDHLLEALARHARFDIELRCQGDLDTGGHHTIEDCALVLGAAIDEALGDRAGIGRFGWAFAPMDASLARAVVDLSGRPAAVVKLGLVRERIADLACENVTHFIESLAMTSRAAMHVDVLRGDNDHHRAEAAFKALALALRQAVATDGSGDIPSTKGVL